MSNLHFAVIAPFIIFALIIGWLFYMAYGGKPLKLTLKGLGLEVQIDTTGNRNRRRSDKPALKDPGAD